MLQLLRLRELPMLLATARARGVGSSSRSRRGACSMCSFRFNCVKLLWQLLRLLPHLWQQFPALFMLGEKNKHSAHTNTHTLSHRHTHTCEERAQHSVRLSKILAFQRFFTCLCREKEKQFSMFTHFISPERRVVLSVPVPTPFPSSLSACLPAVTPSGSRPLWSPTQIGRGSLNAVEEYMQPL